MSARADAIETPRLRLRRRRLEDFPAFAALQADPVLQTYIARRPVGTEEAWAKFLRMEGAWALLGYGFWVVEDKASGRVVGEAGFAEFRRELDPPAPDLPEAGWILEQAAQGRGLASEMVRAMTAWADRRLAADGVFCVIDPANAPSLRVAEKCGFAFSHEARYRGEPIGVHVRRRGGST